MLELKTRRSPQAAVNLRDMGAYDLTQDEGARLTEHLLNSGDYELQFPGKKPRKLTIKCNLVKGNTAGYNNLAILRLWQSLNYDIDIFANADSSWQSAGGFVGVNAHNTDYVDGVPLKTEVRLDIRLYDLAKVSAAFTPTATTNPGEVDTEGEAVPQPVDTGTLIPIVIYRGDGARPDLYGSRTNTPTESYGTGTLYNYQGTVYVKFEPILRAASANELYNIQFALPARYTANWWTLTTSREFFFNTEAQYQIPVTATGQTGRIDDKDYLTYTTSYITGSALSNWDIWLNVSSGTG